MTPRDPRLRLVAALLVVAAISQLWTLSVAAVAFGLAILLAVLGRPDRLPWRRMLHVEGFLLLLFLTLPFTTAGPAMATLGPMTVSSTGLWHAGLIALKVSACMLVVTALLGGLDPVRLGATLQALRVPERFSRLLVMTARYVGLLREEAQRLGEAMRARGFRPRSNRLTWRAYGNLAGMILVRALDRAGRVEEAMLCRGYAGRFPYTVLPAPNRRDWIAFALIACAGILALVVDRL